MSDPDDRDLLREAITVLRDSATGDARMASALERVAGELARHREVIRRVEPFLARMEARDLADDEAGRAQAREEGRAAGHAAGLAEAEKALDVPRAAGASIVEILRSRGGKAAIGAVLLALVAAVLHTLGVPVPAALQALLGGGDGAG